MVRKQIRSEIQSDRGFYVGDICYVLSDEVYAGVWGKKHGYNDGEFTDPETGRSVAVAGTAYGDGTYADDHGHRYPVDAGVIGLVPLELAVRASGDDLENCHQGSGVAKFFAEDGKFVVQLPDGDTIRIDTTNGGEDWEDEDDECDDEEDEDE